MDGWGWSLSKVVVTFNHVGGSFPYHYQGCLNNPIFLNLGLCASCWAHFMCHHELWTTSTSHPFTSLNSSLGLAGGKHYQKITIPMFRFVLQNFAIPGCFPYWYIPFYSYLFFLLSSGWFVILQYVALFQSGSWFNVLVSLQTDAELLSPMASQLNGCPHFFFLYNGDHHTGKTASLLKPGQCFNVGMLSYHYSKSTLGNQNAQLRSERSIHE